MTLELIEYIIWFDLFVNLLLGIIIILVVILCAIGFSKKKTNNSNKTFRK